MKIFVPKRNSWRSVAGLALLAAMLLPAHDLYLYSNSFVAKPGSASTIAFHNGDSFPGSDGPPAFERLRDANVVSAQGTTPLRNIRKSGKTGIGDYTVPEGSYVIAARTTPNFIQLDPKQFEDYLKHEKLDWVIRWRADNKELAKDGRELYSKHSKALLNLDRGDFALRPVGHPVEIVLLDNPAKVGAGATIRAQVLLRGKPVAGQPLEMAWTDSKKTEMRWIGNTAQDGSISVKLATPGVFKLHTIVMERLKNTTTADWESHWASLTFATPAK